MPRRNRIDSNAQAVRIVAAAQKQIVPPSNVPLTAEEMPFFASIIDEFAKADWTPHQLELAAFLAMAMADLRRNQTMLREEGEVVTGGMGSAVVNPRKQAVQMHANNVVAFRRSLALHAAAAGQKADVGKRKAMAKRIEAEASEDDDDLLARPN